jgi:hypothetical protein
LFYDGADSVTTLGGLTMTNNLRDDPKHWLDHAEKARVHAEQMSDPESKRTMLGIAESYGRLARRADQRLRDSEKNENEALLRNIGAWGREWRRRLRRQPERANSSIRLTVLYSKAKTRKCLMSGVQAIGIRGDVALRNHSVAGDVVGGCA